MSVLTCAKFDPQGVHALLYASVLRRLPAKAQKLDVGGQEISSLTDALNAISENYHAWNSEIWPCRFLGDPDEENLLIKHHRFASAVHDHMSELSRRLPELISAHNIQITCESLGRTKDELERSARIAELNRSLKVVKRLHIALDASIKADIAFAHDPTIKSGPPKYTWIYLPLAEAFKHAVSRESGYSDKAAGRFISIFVKEICGQPVDPHATRSAVQRWKAAAK